MNSDSILAILLHNNYGIINKFIFIIPSSKIISEYYCKLFCIRNNESNVKKSWITNYVMKNDLIKLLKLHGSFWYTTHNFKFKNKIYNKYSCPIDLRSYNIDLKLCLNKKKLYSIPKGVSQLINLQLLNLSNNNICAIPSEIGNLIYLSELSLYSNNLLYSPKNYNSQDIIQNNKHILEKFKKIKHMTNLISFPTELSQLTKLTYLNLCGNILLGIPEFIYKLNNLRFLKLRNNLIDVIDSDIKKIPMLQVLSLNNNIVYKLPIELCDMIKLKELELNNNKLTNIEYEMAGLVKKETCLERLTVMGNNIKLIPIDFYNISDFQY